MEGEKRKVQHFKTLIVILLARLPNYTT
jgi:hypothetical protein